MGDEWLIRSVHPDHWPVVWFMFGLWAWKHLFMPVGGIVILLLTWKIVRSYRRLAELIGQPVEVET